MRGDWPPEEGSYHTSVERLRSASYLRATSVAPLDLVVIRQVPTRRRRGRPERPGTKVTATISNPLEAPLEGLTLVFHYEGGRRKPMPRYRERRLPTLRAGTETSIAMPVAIEDDDAWYWFASLSIEGTSAGCPFVSSTYRRGAPH